MSEDPHIYPYRRKNQAAEADQKNILHPFAQAKKKNYFAPREWFSSLGLMEGFLLLAAITLGRAELLGGIYPFGPAFVAAAAIAMRRHSSLFTVAVMLGVLTALGEAAVSYIVVNFILLILFFVYDIDEKKKWIVAPVSVFAVVVVVRTLFMLLAGLTDFDLITVFFEGLFGAGLTAVMLIAFQAINRCRQHQRLTGDELVCVFVVLLGCISGLGKLSIAEVAVGDVLSRLLVMLAAVWGGAGAAAGVGALMGIIPSLSAMVSPTTVGVYAFSGLLAGAFNPFGRIGVALGFFLGNVMLSLYLLESSQIGVQLITSLAAMVLLFLIPNSWIVKGQTLFGKVTLKSVAEEQSDRLLQLAARRLRNTSHIFRELSQNCRSLAQEEKISDDENIQMILNHLSSRVCESCSIRQLCWKIDLKETYAGVMELFNKAEEMGNVTLRDAPENFQKRCPHLRELVATVNCLYELYCRSGYWQEQKVSSQLFLAGQLEGTAQVLDSLAREVGRQNKEREQQEREVTNDLKRSGYLTDGTCILQFGEKTVDLLVNFTTCPGEESCRDLVEETVSRVLQRRYQVHDANCAAMCGERCCYHLLESGARRLTVGRAQLAKAGLGICGDSDGSITLGGGKQMIMLSDGMGVGAKAALQSGTAINMLKRLLEVGFEKDTAIDTVNTILLLQGQEESFVTLDMCIIDLYRGAAEFVKTGGAPSFIKRGNKVNVVKSNSLPVGMLQAVDKVSLTEMLQVGDMVILASDGLLDADCQMDTLWLTKLLEQSEISDPQVMAEFLLGKAISISGGRLRDDITILVAQMSAA